MKAARTTGLLFIVYLFLLIFISKGSFCQENQSNTYERLLRVEVPVKSDNETHKIIPVGSLGVVMFFKSVETVDQDRVKWYFSFYDVDLNLKWSKSIALNQNLEYFNYSPEGDTLNLLFSMGDRVKGSDQELQFIRISLSKSSFIGLQSKIPLKSSIVFFTVQNNIAYISFNTKNETARILSVHLLHGTSRTLAISSKDPSVIADFKVDSITGAITILARKAVPKGLPDVFLSQFDTAFNLIREIPLPSSSPEKQIIAAKIYPLSSSQFEICGTYGSFSSNKSNSKNSFTDESTGLFYIRVIDFKVQSVNFSNYLDFHNYTSLLSGNEMESLKKKAQKKNKEINEYSLELYLLIHPLLRISDRLIFVGESFYPQYHTENYTDFDFYGRPFTNSYTVFDGYRYKHSIVAAFDTSGVLAWDNSIEMRNLINSELNLKSIIYPSGANFVLAYLSEGKIVSKIIHENEVIEKLDASPLETAYSSDKIITDSKNKMMYWYENNFICTGYQEIKNVSLENNNRRWVFYFNKVKFE